MMTLAICWVRHVAGGVEELVFASDSRLSGGNRFDHATKIVTFARPDCAIQFAGDTSWAYPMMIAAQHASSAHRPSRTGALKLSAFKTHLVTMFNQMHQAVHSSVEESPDVAFIFGGYDWCEKAFRVWKLRYDPVDKVFRAHERRGSGGFGGLGKIEFTGDQVWIDRARGRLKEMVQEKFGLGMRDPEDARFDMEPFEVLRDLLRESSPEGSVGGAPQLVKCYQHMNTNRLAVWWPDVSGDIHVLGRPLLGYENIDSLWVLDPDTLRTADPALLRAETGSDSS